MKRDTADLFTKFDALCPPVGSDPDPTDLATVRAMFEARGVEAELVEMVCGGGRGE